MKWIKWFSIAALAIVLLRPAIAQVQHGILWTMATVTTDINGNAITVDGYNMYCSSSSTGPFTTKTNATIIATTFLETGLTVGNTYYCQESAVYKGVEGGHSPTSAGVAFQFPPAAPQAPLGVVQ